MKRKKNYELSFGKKAVFENKTIEEFDSTKADLTYSAGDENKIFIDAITKNTFTFDANKNKIKIY